MAVCDFLRVRHAFPDGMYHIDARGLDDVLMLLYRIAAALQLPVPPDADERILRESLFTALASRSALLYIDRCDQLSGQELAPQFGELVSSLLARAPKVKLLLTCRKSLGVCNEQPLNLAVPELAMAEAKQMLQSMARMPSTHAATLAELCGCMPLALRLCGCALSGKRILLTPDQLIVRLEGETRRLQELHALSETSVRAFKHRPEWTGPGGLRLPARSHLDWCDVAKCQSLVLPCYSTLLGTAPHPSRLLPCRRAILPLRPASPPRITRSPRDCSSHSSLCVSFPARLTKRLPRRS